MQAKCINDQSEEYPNYLGKLSSNKLAGLTKDKLYEVKQASEFDGYFEVINDLGIKENYKKERFESMEEKIKVRCINPMNFKDLTKGKEYPVMDEEPQGYEIINDDKSIRRYHKSQFEKIEANRIDCINYECPCSKGNECTNVVINNTCHKCEGRIPIDYEEQCEKLKKLLAASEDHNKIFSEENERLKKENEDLKWKNGTHKELGVELNKRLDYASRRIEELNKKVIDKAQENTELKHKLSIYETKLQEVKSYFIKLIDINEFLASNIYVEELED